jgi:hypothetical protein
MKRTESYAPYPHCGNLAEGSAVVRKKLFSVNLEDKYLCMAW